MIFQKFSDKFVCAGHYPHRPQAGPGNMAWGGGAFLTSTTRRGIARLAGLAAYHMLCLAPHNVAV